jgi:hypothetical protein
MSVCASPDLGRLEELVRRRVWGQVEGLRLLACDRGLVLRGRAPTYYLKQLAQHAVLGASRLPLVANEIEVVPAGETRPAPVRRATGPGRGS